MKALTDRQLAVLMKVAHARGGEFYSQPSDGAIVGGLVRRKLLTSRRDHNRDLRVSITPLGLEKLDESA